MTTMTSSAAAIELRRAYKRWLEMFWEGHTTLAQIVTEDFPDAEDMEARPTRYEVDAMRDLAQSVAALVVGYEQRG